ncbi:hypothetical protein M514_00862 [Trichuris suis]|uniref:Peptidase A2 domain-containing protein n=1 Tax=Trichuris suis TaxID=68888 RepID=A0A085MLK3_9BILA|nr:hypothetical protein M513_00862 [Trichuris suis]KFD61184.1 hypothetical protein M514_00862 [Trichuris suis]
MVKSRDDALGRMQPLRSESPQELKRFYLQVNGPVSVLEGSGWHSELNSVLMVSQTSDKLTTRLKEQWGGIVQSNLPSRPNPRQFVDWLRDLVMKRRLMPTKSDMVVEERSLTTRGRGFEGPRRKAPSAFSTIVSNSQQCVVCGMARHDINSCPNFAEQSMENRVAVVRRLHLCLVCLKCGHSKRDCESLSKCNVGNCKGRHHSLLHGAPRLFSTEQSKTNHRVELSPRVSETLASQTGILSTIKHLRTVCAVVPVRITYGGTSTQTYALLDSGAEVSLMSRQLGNELKVPDSDRYLDIRTVHGISRIKASETVFSVFVGWIVLLCGAYDHFGELETRCRGNSVGSFTKSLGTSPRISPH